MRLANLGNLPYDVIKRNFLSLRVDLHFFRVI